MKIYGIVDIKADEIVDIFTRPNDVAAVRDITMIAEKNVMFKKYPGDFEIHCFGECEKSHINWNTETKLVNIGTLVKPGEVENVKKDN